MRHEEAKRLYDVLDSARAIEASAAGLTFDSFVSNRTVRDSVYFNFVIIGEALAALRREQSPTLNQISGQYQIIGFRNQVIHGYGSIDHQIT